MGTLQPEQKQQFPTMLGPKPKGFECPLCHQSHTHGSWEDAEIYFDSKTSYHLGCLQSHYKELISKTKLAHENAVSLLQLIEGVNERLESKDNFSHIVNAGLPILRDIITNLKGALHE